MLTDSFDNESINNDIANYIHRRLKVYGDFLFAYFLLNKSSSLRLAVISNYPSDWVSKYKESDFHLIDPVILTASERISPFPWHDNAVINKKSTEAEVFDLAKEYSIINGYTFVLHDQNDNMATLNLSSGDNDSIFLMKLLKKIKKKYRCCLF